MGLQAVEVPARAGCYLLHFHELVGHAGHYLGWAEDMERRVGEHRRGVSGAVLPTMAYRKGIGFTVVRIWPGATLRDEIILKGKSHRPPSPAMRNQHSPRGNGRGRGVKKHCPFCNPRVVCSLAQLPVQ